MTTSPPDRPRHACRPETMGKSNTASQSGSRPTTIARPRKVRTSGPSRPESPARASSRAAGIANDPRKTRSVSCNRARVILRPGSSRDVPLVEPRSSIVIGPPGPATTTRA
jgi:hypothetical protein